MSEEIEKLVKRLRAFCTETHAINVRDVHAAADTIEALRAENERLKAALELVQFNGWQLSTQRQQQHWEVSKPCAQKASETTSVCVWTLTNLTDETGWYEKGCNSETYERWDGHLACPSCGKPIEFTEAE